MSVIGRGSVLYVRGDCHPTAAVVQRQDPVQCSWALLMGSTEYTASYPRRYYYSEGRQVHIMRLVLTDDSLRAKERWYIPHIQHLQRATN
jgi:hypothetical protein